MLSMFFFSSKDKKKKMCCVSAIELAMNMNKGQKWKLTPVRPIPSVIQKEKSLTLICNKFKMLWCFKNVEELTEIEHEVKNAIESHLFEFIFHFGIFKLISSLIF
jgi:hypothetical protein